MEDQSALDRKYFIDNEVFNCPFCNRRNVEYHPLYDFEFDWSIEKVCYGYIVRCTSCDNRSLHLSFENIYDYNRTYRIQGYEPFYRFKPDINIDSVIFYSQPTSFFVVDKRIPRILRELITEAEGCLKMNYLTGASACMRKAIYELLVIEKAEGDDYESRIKSLKKKHPESHASYFDTLAHIQDMTSDKIHEQSWDKWDSHSLKLIIETLKSVLYDIYVIPEIKKQRSLDVQRLRENIKRDKKKTDSTST